MLNHHVRNPRSVGTTVSLTPEQMKLLSNVGIKGKNRLNLLNAKATQRILESNQAKAASGKMTRNLIIGGTVLVLAVGGFFLLRDTSGDE